MRNTFLVPFLIIALPALASDAAKAQRRAASGQIEQEEETALFREFNVDTIALSIMRSG